ncbi:IclR family transcriptional regulator [Haloechinothrix aidingensis]|nr:IclR family transcriptional regulator [Haloechinothrix aidingensis]
MSTAPASMVQRVIRVLLAFEREDPSLTLSEAARRAELPVSTVRRILKELCDEKMLERTDDGSYRIGIRLFELGLRAPAQRLLREIALPVMEDLFAATQENVHLGVLDGTSMLVIQHVTGHRSVRTPAYFGGRLPAHATANGKAFLAFSPQDTIDRILGSGLSRITKHTVCSESRLRRQLEQARQDGWATAKEENSLGTVSIGAPILRNDGYAGASLSLVFRSSKADVKRYIHAVRTAANTIARIWAREQPHA